MPTGRSPRAEAVFNFVLSRSSSETVPFGTVGTANLPVSVNFDDFNYWGIEGGQRFFFTRVRFTPFVGYLIGANRHGDIRAEFVNVPANLLPGYAAQDQKIFEKSWAFSAGPTGGLLVGLGPIEFMGEVQFRFMGGLSDVDWLVEEGLTRHQHRERALVDTGSHRRAREILNPGPQRLVSLRDGPARSLDRREALQRAGARGTSGSAHAVSVVPAGTSTCWRPSSM